MLAAVLSAFSQLLHGILTLALFPSVDIFDVGAEVSRGQVVCLKLHNW